MFSWLSDLVDQFLDFILSLLPSITEPFQSLIDMLPPQFAYLMHLSAMEVVIPITVGAYIIRFLIRRIPVVG